MLSSTATDSLVILLSKANAIKNLNQEQLTNLQSRKGQQVIIEHRYSIQTKPLGDAKRQKTYHEGHIEDLGTVGGQVLSLIDDVSKKNIDDIITSWRYRGNPLKREKIAFDFFLDLRLLCFNDLMRLHFDYCTLLEKYLRLLRDEIESRAAVEVVMHNMALLNVALKEIYVQTKDSVDTEQRNKVVTSYLKNLPQQLDTLQTQAPETNGDSDLQKKTAPEMQNEGNLVNFGNGNSLDCRYVLSAHKSYIWALEICVLNGKQFLASASHDAVIKLWDLSNYTVATTLRGHTDAVYSLSFYEQNGAPMLASGGTDEIIKLWDLSNKINVQSLSGHDATIFALTTYEKDDRTILISASKDSEIKVWDLEDYSIIATLQGHKASVNGLYVYNQDGKDYLASSSHDKTIKIWNLDENSLVTTLDDDLAEVWHTLVLDHKNKKFIVSGDNRGYIKLWSLGTHKCIQTIKASNYVIQTLQVLRYNSKICLAYAGDDMTVKIWDLQHLSVVTALESDCNVLRIKTFMNGNRACLISGDQNGKIKIWM